MLTVAAIYSLTSVAGKGAMVYATPESFGALYFALIGSALAAGTALYQPANLRVLTHQPIKTLVVGGLMAIMIVTHFLALSLVEVAYMIAVKRTSLLFAILLGALMFKERHLAQHLGAGGLMVAGVTLILI